MVVMPVQFTDHDWVAEDDVKLMVSSSTMESFRAISTSKLVIIESLKSSEWNTIHRRVKAVPLLRFVASMVPVVDDVVAISSTSIS